MFAKLLHFQSSWTILLKISLLFIKYTFIKSVKVMSRNSTISFPRNSQMSPRPIFISDSRDTKEWPCFVGQIFFQAYLLYFTHLFAQLRQKKRKKPICTVTFNTMVEIYIQSATNISNETYTFMCVGRAGRFGHCYSCFEIQI